MLSYVLCSTQESSISNHWVHSESNRELFELIWGHSGGKGFWLCVRTHKSMALMGLPFPTRAMKCHWESFAGIQFSWKRTIEFQTVWLMGLFITAIIGWNLFGEDQNHNGTENKETLAQEHLLCLTLYMQNCPNTNICLCLHFLSLGHRCGSVCFSDWACDQIGLWTLKMCYRLQGLFPFVDKMQPATKWLTLNSQ